LKSLCGVEIREIAIDAFLGSIQAVPDTDTVPVRARVENDLGDLSELEPDALTKSLKIYKALRTLADDEGYAGIAIRCWPEFFTELGAAACGPMGMMGEDGTPCGCEADVYGTISTLILRWLGDRPAFNSDLVDVDVADDTAVFWHCGQAPISMADPEGPKRATVHSNRKMPLLYEFPFKPGRVTLARLSQSRNRTRMVIGGGEVLKRPISFSGTSGVVRFDCPASDVLDRILAEGLEHHISLAYGEHRPALRRLATLMKIPVLELT
jgi:L-fucose isomerase-like protein